MSEKPAGMNAIASAMSRPKTKIVCTLGPSTESHDTIAAMIREGMSVARLNLSHGAIDGHAAVIQRVRSISKQLAIPVGIMVDIPGPKYRVGALLPGVVDVAPGDGLTLTSREIGGTKETIGVSPSGIHRDASVDAPIFLDDGLIELRVVNIARRDVLCEVVVGGRISEGRGVTTPGKSPSQRFPGELTEQGLRFAAEQGADFVALSVVTTAQEVIQARSILSGHGLDAHIISKIERTQALENLEDILEASDGIIVARGDLGTDVPLARVPTIQKDLIARANLAGKPVVTATQMLESMERVPTPTRAEVTDVANAVFDGSDAVMLSGETAVGQYPVEAVRVMAQVAIEAEAALPYESMIREKARQLEEQTDDAISYDACRTAYQLKARLIVAFTESGGTAARVSKYRPRSPILALTPWERGQLRLTLRWGVTPVVVEPLRTVEDFFAKGEEQAVKSAGVEPGSLVVLVAGVPIGVSGGTNLLRVMKIPGAGDIPEIPRRVEETGRSARR